MHSTRFQPPVHPTLWPRQTELKPLRLPVSRSAPASPMSSPTPAPTPVSTASHNLGFVLRICLVATLGGFLFGFDSGVINGTVDGLRLAFDSTSVGTGFNVASMLLGCAAGAFFAGRLADRFGRRNILIFAAVCFIVSAWGSGIATGSGEFVLYRVLGGFAVGAASVLCPAYISEVSPARLRGALSSVQQIAIISGLFISFVSNYLIARYAGTSTAVFYWGYEAWRWMFWIELAPAGFFLVALFLIPESPRYLVSAGRYESALRVLERILPGEGPAKLAEIKASLSADHRPRLRDLFDAAGRLHPVVWVGVGLAVLQQAVGINVVFYYGAVLWQSAGFTESDALLINIVSGALSIGACLLATWQVDRIGRKPLLLAGSIGMTLSLGVVALVFAGAEAGSGGQLVLTGLEGPIALVAANLYVMVFNATWGPVVWILLGEMFPNRFRGSALGLAGFSMWVANFGVTMSFPAFLTGIGLGGAYGIYAAFALLSVGFTWRWVRETKGRELEAMSER